MSDQVVASTRYVRISATKQLLKERPQALFARILHTEGSTKSYDFSAKFG